MASWFSRRRKLGESPRLKPRRQSAQVTKVDLADLTPEPSSYLGQAAYLQLEASQSFSRAGSEATDVAVKEASAAAAAAALARHEALLAEIRRAGDDPAEVMDPFAGAIERFQRSTIGADWQENLLGAYLVSGLLNDFFVRMADGLPHAIKDRVLEALNASAGFEPIVRILREAIAADPPLGSRLALWGRRLVGDTLLVARSALIRSGNAHSDEQRIEPVFTELIAAHTRRMDALGLTA